MKKQLLCLGAILIMIQGVSAFYLGVAPGTNDMGTLERGETYEAKIFIETNYDGELELNPSVVRPSINSLETISSSNNAEFSMDEYSAEKIDSWVNFREVEYEQKNVDTNSGSTSVDGELSYFIEVPRNAEPGYHVAKINLNPDYSSAGGGASVSTVAISTHHLVFRVPGEAERSIEVSDIEGLRSGDSQVRIRMKAQNTGSVTTAVRPSSNNVFTDSGQKISSFDIGGTYLKPGETSTLKGAWRVDDSPVTAGNYRTRGQLNYVTGKAFFDSSFSITDYIQIEQADNDSSGQILPSGDSQDSPPLMFIVIGLVLTGSLLYAFEIDPLLIILALGMFAISSIIWFTAIPTSAIALVVLLSAGLFYYGWM